MKNFYFINIDKKNDADKKYPHKQVLAGKGLTQL